MLTGFPLAVEVPETGGVPPGEGDGGDEKVGRGQAKSPRASEEEVFHSNHHQFICLISTIHSNEHNFICMIGVHIHITYD